MPSHATHKGNGFLNCYFNRLAVRVKRGYNRRLAHLCFCIRGLNLSQVANEKVKTLVGCNSKSHDCFGLCIGKPVLRQPLGLLLTHKLDGGDFPNVPVVLEIGIKGLHHLAFGVFHQPLAVIEVEDKPVLVLVGIKQIVSGLFPRLFVLA